jgi:hypothetical protein
MASTIRAACAGRGRRREVRPLSCGLIVVNWAAAYGPARWCGNLMSAAMGDDQMLQKESGADQCCKRCSSAMELLTRLPATGETPAYRIFGCAACCRVDPGAAHRGVARGEHTGAAMKVSNRSGHLLHPNNVHSPAWFWAASANRAASKAGNARALLRVQQLARTKGGRGAMKMVAEYLEHAHRFERMAAAESDPKLKAQLPEQAAAYYKLAANRAEAQGTPAPRTEAKWSPESEPT